MSTPTPKPDTAASLTQPSEHVPPTQVVQQVVHEDPRGQVVLEEACVSLRLVSPHRVLSFSPYAGGFGTTRLVAIHEVKNADLPKGFDPLLLLAERMRKLPEGEHGVGMLTSRRIGACEVEVVASEGVSARVLVTAGLSNAVRVGDTPGPLKAWTEPWDSPPALAFPADGTAAVSHATHTPEQGGVRGLPWGTINIVCALDCGLTDVALLEAMSVVAEARTTAVIEACVGSRRSGRHATGTGTDCIAVLAALPREPGPREPGPSEPGLSEAAREPLAYAGKHTAVGHVLGAATLIATARALAAWKAEYTR
jgi:adenosylcobinamide amidohydrolase